MSKCRFGHKTRNVFCSVRSSSVHHGLLHITHFFKFGAVDSTRLYIVVRCGLYSVRLATISSSQQVGSNISYVTYGWVKHKHFISYSIIPNKSKHTKVRYSPEKLVWPPSLLVTVRIILIIIIIINIVDNAPKNPYKC